MNILKNCVRMSCRYCVEVSMKKVMIFHSGSLESCHKLNFFNIQSTLQIFCVRTHDDLLCSILSCIINSCSLYSRLLYTTDRSSLTTV